MKLSECCGAKLANYDKDWDDGICLECKEHSPAQTEELVDQSNYTRKTNTVKTPQKYNRWADV